MSWKVFRAIPESRRDASFEHFKCIKSSTLKRYCTSRIPIISPSPSRARHAKGSSFSCCFVPATPDQLRLQSINVMRKIIRTRWAMKSCVVWGDSDHLIITSSESEQNRQIALLEFWLIWRIFFSLFTRDLTPARRAKRWWIQLEFSRNNPTRTRRDFRIKKRELSDARAGQVSHNSIGIPYALRGKAPRCGINSRASVLPRATQIVDDKVHQPTLPVYALKLLNLSQLSTAAL